MKGTTNRFFSLDSNPLHGTCGWSSSCRYSTGARLLKALYTRTRVDPLLDRSGVAKGGAGGANAPPQIFVVQLLPKTPIGNRST